MNVITRRRIFVFPVIILIFSYLSSVSVFSHSGSLDENGGHYNRQTGVYHYHDGTHTTGENATDKQTMQVEAPEKTPLRHSPLGIFVVSLLILALAYIWFLVARYKEKEIHINKFLCTNEPNQCPIENFNFPMPFDTELDKNGLPKLKKAQYGWGRKYNAFVSQNGNCYHRSRCQVLNGKKKTVMHLYLAIGKYKPCMICRPRNKIDEWYTEYIEFSKGKQQNFVELNGVKATEMSNILTFEEALRLAQEQTEGNDHNCDTERN